MAKSAHEIWQYAKENNLSDEEYKELLKKEKVIIPIENYIKKNELNWAEDFSHENGNYSNICMDCKEEFFGHKRRVICKKCFTKRSDKTVC